MLVFTLRQATVVQFVVVEVAPDCRRIGRFRVAGHPGVNRVRFRSRVGRHTLRPGSYRIVARTLPDGRAVAQAKLVVVRRPGRAEIASGRGANACDSLSQARSAAPGSGSFSSTKPSSSTSGAPGKDVAKGAEPARARSALGARFARGAVDAAAHIPPWLYVLIGVAIALLGVASLPLSAAPTNRSAAALAENRAVIALGGAAVLVAAAVAFALS